MDENKKRVKHCPNFYRIMNFIFYEDDTLSKKIIDVYQKFVFEVDLSDKKNITKLEHFDTIVGKYIDDHAFRNELKAQMKRIQVRKGVSAMDAVVDWIFNVFDNYEFGYTKNIYFSRWF
jgi:hypothetical protein